MEWSGADGLFPTRQRAHAGRAQFSGEPRLMSAFCMIRIGLGALCPTDGSDVVRLTVQDVRGTYTLPYIQSDTRLDVTVEFTSEALHSVHLGLSSGGRRRAAKRVTPRRPRAALGPVPPGEYILEAVGCDAEGKPLFHRRFTRVGIGAGIDALVERLDLRHGPDLLEAYSTDRAQWYGDDPVHPNVAGVARMAELWHDAIVKALPDVAGDQS